MTIIKMLHVLHTVADTEKEKKIIIMMITKTDDGMK